MTEFQQMVKCNLFYNRSGISKNPMRATICPAASLTYRTMGEIRRTGVEIPSKFVEVRWRRSENNAVSGKTSVLTIPGIPQ